MMVEAEATEGTLEPHQGRRRQARRGGRRAGSRGIEAVPQAARRGAAAAREHRRQGDPADFPVFLPYSQETLRLRRRPRLRRAQGHLPDRRQGRAQERRRRAQGPRQGRAARGQSRRASCPPSRTPSSRPPTSRSPRRSCAHASSPRASASTAVACRHPSARRRGAGHPARSRLGDLPARRDPDPGRHHAEHAQDGAADRLAVAR